VLYNFCSGANGGCAGGGQPITRLTYDGAEHGLPYDGVSPLYGGTQIGGRYFSGTVYALERSGGAWNAWSIYDFCKAPSCPDGAVVSGLLPDGMGHLVGTASGGGNPEGQFSSGGVVSN
jgi:hypothetical protein